LQQVFKNVPGFEDSYQKEVFDVAAKLFNKPQGWKDNLSTSESPALRGYWRADTIEGAHKAMKYVLSYKSKNLICTLVLADIGACGGLSLWLGEACSWCP
jgi:hypothetical protein